MTREPIPSPPAPLRIAVLASGSSGNCIAVTDGADTLLVDCGISARETLRRLDLAGIDAASVRGVLVTHEHVDHVRGIRVLVKRTGATVWATPGTRDAANLEAIAPEVRSLVPGSLQHMHGFDVLAFRTSHDAADPVGFRMERAGETLGIMTDTGIVTEQAEEALAGCDVLAIESNHDREMLEFGPYPYFLKRRIASAQGHLANEVAADLVERLATDRLREVFALHLSRTNNTPRHATNSMRAALARLDHPARFVCGKHDEPTWCARTEAR